MWTVRQREERRSAESPDVAWVVELQTAKRWLEQQYKAWQRLADERGQALADLESAKRWLEEQYQAWQRTAEERAQALADLESGKQWLEQQYEAWRHTAGEREVVIGELRECVAKLERSNRLLEEANAAMRRELEELRRTGFAGWFGRRPRGVERTEAPNQLALHSPAPDKETTR